MTSSARSPLGARERIRKLRAMSLDELWTRLRYEAYCRVERREHARRGLASHGSFRRALAPSLAKADDWRDALVQARLDRSTRFFDGVEQRELTRALFLERYPNEVRFTREGAARAARREFSFFGETFHYGHLMDWHADPVTGARWPRVYHRDVPIHAGDVGFGDVKYVWELGRHQFLIDLAKAWALDREPRHSDAVRAFVAGWRAENPVGTGVAWSCALEPAFRVLSWLWAYFLVLDDPAMDRDTHVDWLDGFHDHGWFLYRHLEYYTSPFNHLAGEACALYCLGVLFPEFAEARKWRRHGRHLLESRLSGQFHPDGASVEQSTFYHHATTGFYLLAALLGRANGEEFSPEVWKAIERGIEFSALLQQPDGTTPTIGGGDDGKPIRLEHLPLWDFRPYQAIGAVLFRRRDFKAAAERFHEDALWLLGARGAADFAALPCAAPAPSSRVFPASGYVVIRNRWGHDADYLCFDSGEQAGGLRRDEVPSAAHGHADCLSILLWRGGKPVLVDPGFYCYNGPKAWEDHFRETAAHNTVRIDGQDQALHINKMAWSHTYTATLEGCAVDGADPWAVGSHDGYRSLPEGPVLHRRAVWVRSRGYVVVCDFLEGAGEHDMEFTWQFAPGCLRVDEAQAWFEDRVTVHWFAPVNLTVRAHEGGPGPDGGWIAPSLGVKTAAPRLVVAGRSRLPATVVTIIADAGEAGPEVAAASPDGSGPIVVSGRGWIDWLLVKGVDRGSGHALETDALAAAWVQRGEQCQPDGRIGGTFQSAGT